MDERNVLQHSVDRYQHVDDIREALSDQGKNSPEVTNRNYPVTELSVYTSAANYRKYQAIRTVGRSFQQTVRKQFYRPACNGFDAGLGS